VVNLKPPHATAVATPLSERRWHFGTFDQQIFPPSGPFFWNRVELDQCGGKRVGVQAAIVPATQEPAMIAAPFVVLAIGSQLFITVAEGVPVFDAAAGCRAAQSDMPANFEACMKDEQNARAQLGAEWDRFLASDRATCTQNEMDGGTPSYVELLTCLQMARDALSLPGSETEGSGR
jgi:hypothetical protein